jgi:hypothetical protein
MDKMVVPLFYKGIATVAVGTLDLRSDVLNGMKHQSVYGSYPDKSGAKQIEMRIPGDQPFAEVITAALCRSLAARGFRCDPVKLNPGTDQTSAQGLLMLKKAEMSVLLELHEWATRTVVSNPAVPTFSTVATYSGTLLVFSAEGAKAAEIRVREESKQADHNMSAKSAAVAGADNTGLELQSVFLNALMNDEAVRSAFEGK